MMGYEKGKMKKCTVDEELKKDVKRAIDSTKR